MITDFFCCITVLIFFILITIVIYVHEKRFRRFFHIVIFPIPIVIFVSFILYGITTGGYEKEYGFLIGLMFILSMTSGMGILLHCYFDRNKKDWLLNIRIIASLILISTPFLIYLPSLHFLMLALFFIAGIIIGVYGFTDYYNGNKIGLLYVYSSIVFMIIVPVIALAIIKLYSTYISDEIIYKRAYDGWVSCHLAAAPTLLDQESFVFPTIFSAGYTGFIGILTAIRKDLLEKKLKKEKIIPKEFDEIINNKERKNE